MKLNSLNLCIFIVLNIMFIGNTFGQRMGSSLSGGYKNDIARIVLAGGNNFRTKAGLPPTVGHPYVSDVWLKGEVNFMDGGVRSVERLNYDALDHLLIMELDGVELEFTSPVKSFTLFEDSGPRNFTKINDVFYEVLYQGKFHLLRWNNKIIKTEGKYGSAWADGKIAEENVLFLMQDDMNLIKIKKTNSLIEALKGNKSEIRNYVQEHRLNFKKEQDIIVVLEKFGV